MTAQDPTLQIVDNPAAATEEALAIVSRLVATAVQERGRCFIALAGGNTPSGLYSRLGRPPLVDQMPWTAVQIFFTDERCVGPDDPQSNYGMVKRTLLEPAPIPAENVHRIKGELDPDQAAAAYQAELEKSFGIASDAVPRFDFILLGMGPDGHTASLFPHTAALDIRDRLVAANWVPQMNTNRITLTLSVLNSAREILFLVSGEDKAEALQTVLEMPPNPDGLPSQLIQPPEGHVTWLVDRAAGAKLRQARGNP
ncbi:MAG: 6-phosphogluconolactonase [Dehalococcoidia bacterium]